MERRSASERRKMGKRILGIFGEMVRVYWEAMTVFARFI